MEKGIKDMKKEDEKAEKGTEGIKKPYETVEHCIILFSILYVVYCRGGAFFRISSKQGGAS